MHKHKHKKKAYAYVAAVLTRRLLMLMFALMLASQVRTGLRKYQKEEKNQEKPLGPGSFLISFRTNFDFGQCHEKVN